MGSLAVAVTPAASADRVERMLAAAPHRGGAIDAVSAGRVTLGVSNDPAFVDSWTAQSDGLIAAFSGALDTHSELGDPAAAVLALFREHGEAFVERLRGVFAGVVSDGERAWVFRDQFGFRTLFHRRDANGFFAAS